MPGLYCRVRHPARRRDDGVLFLLGSYEAVISTTDDIASALRAGERWRADVRAATEKSPSKLRRPARWCGFPKTERRLSIALVPAKCAGEIPAAIPNCCWKGQNVRNEIRRAAE